MGSLCRTLVKENSSFYRRNCLNMVFYSCTSTQTLIRVQILSVVAVRNLFREPRRKESAPANLFTEIHRSRNNVNIDLNTVFSALCRETLLQLLMSGCKKTQLDPTVKPRYKLHLAHCFITGPTEITFHFITSNRSQGAGRGQADNLLPLSSK